MRFGISAMAPARIDPKSSSSVTLTVASACFGVYYGTFVSLFPAVMSDCFGRQHAGALTGLSFAMGSVPSALGPVLMGWVADRTGQYMLAFLGGTVVNGLVLVLGMLERPPVRPPTTQGP